MPCLAQSGTVMDAIQRLRYQGYDNTKLVRRSSRKSAVQDQERKQVGFFRHRGGRAGDAVCAV